MYLNPSYSSSCSNPNIIDVDFDAYESARQQQTYAYVDQKSPHQQQQQQQQNYSSYSAPQPTIIDQTRSKSSTTNSIAERYQNPYYKGTYLSDKQQARMQAFTTEKTQVNIPSQIGGHSSPPEVKERRSIQQKSVDIDFRAYDEPTMSIQHGSRAKIVRYF